MTGKTLFHIISICFLFFAAIYIFLPQEEQKKEKEEEKKEFEIQKPFQEKIVRGSSMYPLLSDGDVVKVFFNYYDTEEIKRNDMVLYNYAGNDVPLIKLVKGVPGDFFELREKNGVWNIYINEKLLKNSEEKEYSFSKNRYNMLALYEKNYKEEGIPENTFLILGDSTNPVTDSSRFGFVGKNDIMGKAIKK